MVVWLKKRDQQKLCAGEKRELSTAVITSDSEAQGPRGCESMLQRAAEHH